MSRQPVIMVVPPGAQGVQPTGLWRWGRAPGILTHLVAKLWLIGVLYATSDVVNHNITLAILLLVGGFIALRWGVSVGINMLGTLFGRVGVGLGGRIRFLIMPLIFVAAFYAWQYRPGLYIRMLWSMAPLQAFVDFDAKEFHPDDAGRWVGLFQVYHVESKGNLICIRTTPLTDPAAGLAFLQSGRPTSGGSEQFRPLYSPWWAWYPDSSTIIPKNISRIGEMLTGYTSAARETIENLNAPHQPSTPDDTHPIEAPPTSPRK